MSEQKQGSEPRPFHIESDGLIFDKPKSQEAIARETRDREQHEFARVQVTTNKQLARFSGALVVATFFTIAVGVWQGTISQTAATSTKDAVRVAGETLHETERSNKVQEELNQRIIQATVNNFRVDERAWIEIGKIEKYLRYLPTLPSEQYSILAFIQRTSERQLLPMCECTLTTSMPTLLLEKIEAL